MEKKQYIPLSLLIILSIKALVLGASAADVAFLSVFAGLAAFYEFKIERNDFLALKKQQEIQALAIEVVAKDMHAYKSYLAAQKMNSITPVGKNAKLTF